jgi:MFS superfamily sulfate permease-like transporter
LLIVRPDEEVFFANAAMLHKSIRELAMTSAPERQAVILDMEMTSELDVPSVEMLGDLHGELKGQKIRLIIAGLHAPVSEMMDRSGITEQIGEDNVFSTVLEAVLVYAQIDMLTQMISVASEQAGVEQQDKLNEAIGKLDDIRSGFDADGGTPTGTGAEEG